MSRPTVSRCVLTLAIAAVAVAPCPAAAQTSPTRTVLSIHWGPEVFPGTENLDQGIREILVAHPRVPINYFAEYLEDEQFPPETAAISLRDFIREKFAGRHIDLVIANASGALQFALRFRAELFADAPIVFSAVSVPQDVRDGKVSGITGLVRDVVFADSLELALRLHPSLKRVFVIAHAPAAAGYDERVQSSLRRFADRVELIFMQQRTLPALLDAVRAIPPGSLIFYTRYSPIGTERNVYPDEIGALIAQAAPVPMYASSELPLGRGIVGGSVRDGIAVGRRIGEIAVRVLEGTPPAAIPIGTVPTVPIFDWRQIERWGIDPSSLPPESQIRFRTPTAWEQYRGPIVGTIVVVIAQLLLIAALLTQHARRRKAEDTIRAREASLRTSYERIRQLTGRLINAQEATRASIAQDLHDDVCQRLTTVSLAVDSLKASSGELQGTVAQDALAELARETGQAYDGIRRLSHELHPVTLRVLGLAAALKGHCAEVAKRHNVEAAFTSHGDLRQLDPDVAVCFFRIAQEALRNGIVHGSAQRLSVSLNRSGNNVELVVTDDGRGFDLDDVRRRGGGLGLVSMEERAHAIGGDIRIISAVGQGTTIRVRGAAEPPVPAPQSEIVSPARDDEQVLVPDLGRP